ncbi:C1 family peptidase [Pseudophaeobacter sp.]|uniref:C1 family peptidase n=1 Tax=Pseudophaeobacter sp. TaxID=1971739 RepID=UPI00221001FF|nr:C1 family peptidase [Phaeobacter sp. G2]
MPDFPTPLGRFFAGFTPPESLDQLFRAPGYAEWVHRCAHLGASSAESALRAQVIDLEAGMSPHWDPRDQRPRGTCTAFAVAACVDILQARRGEQPVLHSPEYLYWHMRAAITAEEAAVLPDYARGATKLKQAHKVLAARGICTEALTPYQTSDLQNGLFSKHAPPEAAEADAATRRFCTVKYEDFENGPVAETTADSILQELSQGRPVALGLPVFKLKNSHKNNWTYNGALNSGIVFDPVARPDLVDREVRVSGHCVCVTGFQPGPEELGGGWFIFRNSWNGDFGKYPDDPLAGYPGVGRRGNGAVSLDYVNGYTVEYLSLIPAD